MNVAKQIVDKNPADVEALLASPAEFEEGKTVQEALVGKIYSIINKIAKQEGVDESGFRIVVNCKEDGGQEVPHLHFHIIGGKKLGTKIC